jgi:hypothetical protein
VPLSTPAGTKPEPSAARKVAAYFISAYAEAARNYDDVDTHLTRAQFDKPLSAFMKDELGSSSSEKKASKALAKRRYKMLAKYSYLVNKSGVKQSQVGSITRLSLRRIITRLCYPTLTFYSITHVAP